MKAADFIFFGRPMLLLPVWTVYLHFISQLNHYGRFHNFPTATDGWLLLSLTLAFMGTYVINQIFDIESDRVNNKLFFLPQKIISIRSAWGYYSLLSAFGIAAAFFVSLESAVIAGAIVLLGVLYSIPGVRLKDRPIGGLLANAVAYGFLVPAIAGPPVVSGHAGLMTAPYFLAIACGYILTTIPDRIGDGASGKMTVAVILGEKSVRWLALLTAGATGAVSFTVRNWDMLAVAAITAFLVLGLFVKKDDRFLLFTCKFPILLLTILAGLFFPVYLAFLLLTWLLTRAYYKHRFGIVYPKLS